MTATPTSPATLRERLSGEDTSDLVSKVRERVASARLEPETGCLIWQGTKTSAGYARVYHGGRNYSVTRVLLGLPPLTNGGVASDDLLACHHCDNPSCVNEAHLFVGTTKDNMRDARQKNRMVAGWLNRTTCPAGHPITPENIYEHPSGNLRKCRECMRLAATKRRHRKARTDRRYRWIDDEFAPKGKRRVRVIEFEGRNGYAVTYTTACSGCFEFGDYGGLAHNYAYDEKHGCHVGSGCDECGYTGKRRQSQFIPFDNA